MGTSRDVPDASSHTPMGKPRTTENSWLRNTDGQNLSPIFTAFHLRLEKKITHSRFWPVEIFKTPIPTNTKGKKVIWSFALSRFVFGLWSLFYVIRTLTRTLSCNIYSLLMLTQNEDDQPITFHGVAYVNLSPLLYPGGKSILKSHAFFNALLSVRNDLYVISMMTNWYKHLIYNFYFIIYNLQSTICNFASIFVYNSCSHLHSRSLPNLSLQRSRSVW